MTSSGRQRTKGLILNKISLIGGRLPTPAMQSKFLNGTNAVQPFDFNQQTGAIDQDDARIKVGYALFNTLPNQPLAQ